MLTGRSKFEMVLRSQNFSPKCLCPLVGSWVLRKRRKQRVYANKSSLPILRYLKMSGLPELQVALLALEASVL